jgi:hypothetical protein
LLAHGRWFSPASSTTKTGRHDIAESGIKHQKSINQSYHIIIASKSTNATFQFKYASHGQTTRFLIL